ncbi:MAG: glycosyltransferase family 4 protein [Planctomycetes bacterium]|nr:glycosyltransferase family 4 protein [Planctomycetota bacterium]
MRITALVKSREHVCCRYRAAAFRAHFESLGHHVDIRSWSSAWFLCQLFPGLQSDIDVLIVQRRLFPAWQLNLLRRRVSCLIFDFDDSIYLHSSFNLRGPDCSKRLARFRHMMQTADIVIAGNDFLRDQATALTDPAKVHVIPTCVEVGRYPSAAHDPHRPRVKLAWIGSSSTIRGLEKQRDLLERFGRVVPNLELTIICDRSLSLDHLPIDFRLWNETTETADLADADIGFSWLPDDAWSAGKCGLKVLQYMAAGLPVIANAVGVQKTLVRHGETGFLVDTPDEWEAAVRRLANDADLRRLMGAAGRRVVAAEYDVARGAAAWENVLRGIEAVRA